MFSGSLIQTVLVITWQLFKKKNLFSDINLIYNIK